MSDAWGLPPAVEPDDETVPDIPGWPRGAPVWRVIESAVSGVPSSQTLLDDLAQHREGLAADGQHRAIGSFGGAD